MSYQFEGRVFRTLADFQREYPVYRTYTDLLKGGATSVLEMEKAIHERNVRAKAACLRAARSNNAYTIVRKREA